MSYERNADYLSYLDKVPLFNVLNQLDKEIVAGTGTLMQFQKDDVIVREGEDGNLFYMILSGVAEIVQNGRHIRYTGEGDFFGE